jgi:uncharacterized protein (DUF4415 family)
MSAKKPTRRDEQDREVNPEWTAKDFRRARPAAEVLPAAALSAFKAVRGAQKAPTKVPISIRLGADILDHYKAAGPGWQSRMERDLRKAAGLK